MQSTLVAFYGKKPEILVNFLNNLKGIISQKLRNAFKPYDNRQIHATITGLEAKFIGNELINRTYKKVTKTLKPINFNTLINFLKITNLLPITIQIGGFSRNKYYNFNSNGEHPFYRSFLISKEKIIIIGWPFLKTKYQNSLYILRDELTKFNVIHRYNKDDKKDNDFYFALGQVEEIDKNTRVQVENEMRVLLSEMDAIKIKLEKDDLSLVFYYDYNLPLESSISFNISDNQLNEVIIKDLYNK